MQSTNFIAGYILYNCVCDEYKIFTILLLLRHLERVAKRVLWELSCSKKKWVMKSTVFWSARINTDKVIEPAAAKSVILIINL